MNYGEYQVLLQTPWTRNGQNFVHIKIECVKNQSPSVAWFNSKGHSEVSTSMRNHFTQSIW